MLATILVVLYVVVCIALIVVVLLQSGKGEGLAGVFGGGSTQAIFGARTGDVLTKGTSIIAVAFMLLSVTLALLSVRKDRLLSEDISQVASQMQVPPPASGEGAPESELPLPAGPAEAPAPSP